MTDDELIAAFEASTLAAAAFPHREHVRAAWWYVRRYPLDEAIGRFGRALRRFAAAKRVARQVSRALVR